MVLHLSGTSFGDLPTKRISFSWRQRLKKVEHSSQDGVALSSMLMYFLIPPLLLAAISPSFLTWALQSRFLRLQMLAYSALSPSWQLWQWPHRR